MERLYIIEIIEDEECIGAHEMPLVDSAFPRKGETYKIVDNAQVLHNQGLYRQRDKIQSSPEHGFFKRFLEVFDGA